MIHTLRKQKIEVFTIKEFLAPQPKDSIRKAPLINNTLFSGFMGIDIGHKTFFSHDLFATPYYVVFAVFAVAMLSTTLEYIYRSRGDERKAEAVETFTRILFPVCFYIFLYFGLILTF